MLIERRTRLDRTKPRVGNDDAVLPLERLDETERERRRLLVLVAVLLCTKDLPFHGSVVL